MTKEKRHAFALSRLEAVEKYKLDGIDIDREYPYDGSADIDYSSKDKENYTYLFEELREVKKQTNSTVIIKVRLIFKDGFLSKLFPSFKYFDPLL